MFVIFASDYMILLWQDEILSCLLAGLSDPGLSMNILHAGDKSPVQRVFFKSSAGDFLGGLYNFDNFVTVLSFM